MALKVPEGFKEITLEADLEEGYQKDLESLYKKLTGLNIKDGNPNTFALSELLNERVEFGSTALVLVYFPERGDIFLTGDMEVKENINERTGKYEANIIFRNYLDKRDTRKSPVLLTVEDYEDAKERDALKIGKFEYYRVLERGPRYFVYIEEPKGPKEEK